MTEEKTEELTAARIYVGGLGERVTEDDLRNTFSNLGSVKNVEIIRTKGRSFAYINFLPSSQTSLPKLFSMYNGCSWKGGKLKLEKAKEHYMDRLKREWDEDAELLNSAHTDHVDGDESIVAAEPMSRLDSEKMQIRIFFPKLRKVKSLPFRGTGKHKYSFQRIQEPSRPVHFCDCPEHSAPVQTPKEAKAQKPVMNRVFQRETCSGSERSQLRRETEADNSKIQDGGVNEEEINVMNSVMKKLLERETSSKKEQRQLQDSSQPNVSTSEFTVDTNEIDDGIGTDDDDDDDDIKINVVAGQKNGSFSESWELQTSLVNKMARSNEQLKAAQSKPRMQKKREKPSGKKSKSLLSEKERASPQKKARVQAKSNDSDVYMEESDIVTEHEPKKSRTQNGACSQKSAWKELIGNGVSSSFSLSQVTPDDGPGSKEQPKPCKSPRKNPRVQTKSNDTEVHMAESDIVAEPEPKKSSTQKGARSRKSAWKELVGTGVSSSFSLSQVTPDDGPGSVEQPETCKSLRKNLLMQAKSNDLVHLEESDIVAEPEPKESSTRKGAQSRESAWKELVGNGVSSSFSLSHVTPDDGRVSEERSKPVNRTSSDLEEVKGVDNAVNEILEAEQSRPSKKEEVLQDQPAGPNTDADKSAKGSSWLQKSPWTQLVGGGTSGSFSISQILPQDMVEKQNQHKTNAFSTTVTQQRTSEAAFGGSRGLNYKFGSSSKKKDALVSKVTSSKNLSNATSSKKSDSEPKKTSISVSGVGVSESCPFMRSDDSLKDWMTAKTSLSKKRGNNNSNNNKQG